MTEHSKTNQHKRRERSGRWTKPEADLFEELLERYGKNWIRIQQHMKGRTLSQVRSHAQKFFSKVGPRRVEAYSRRANLLFAYDLLRKEKLLQQQEKLIIQDPNMKERKVCIKNEEVSHTNSFLERQGQSVEVKLSGRIKEQNVQTPVRNEQELIINQTQNIYGYNDNTAGFYVVLMPPNLSNFYENETFGRQMSNFNFYN